MKSEWYRTEGDKRVATEMRSREGNERLSVVKKKKDKCTIKTQRTERMSGRRLREHD